MDYSETRNLDRHKILLLIGIDILNTNPKVKII